MELKVENQNRSNFNWNVICDKSGISCQWRKDCLVDGVVETWKILSWVSNLFLKER